MMSKINSILLVIVLLVNSANCYKILSIFPHMGKSHFATFEPILKALVARGNEVTVLSEFPQKSPLPGYNDVILESADEINTEILHIEDIPPFWISKLANTIVLAKFGRQSCKHLSQKSVQDLIKSNEVFDVILIEYFNTDCFLGFAHKFKAPFIGLSSCVLMPYHNERMGNPDNPSYITQHFGDYHIPMNFLERVENTIAVLYHRLMYKILADLPGNQIARQYFGEDLPPLSEIARNTSLFLVNSHFSLNRPRPLVPGFIEIGGVHIGKQKDLPQDIEKWIKESPHGVIYFSMGSMIKGHTFPEEKRKAFLRAFGRLKQRVLWKWENDTMPEKPDNVMIQKWMPQFDILCHPNVKAFISHGGLLGTTETVHCGVPAVVMPQFGDQFTNARALEASGGGIVLQFSTVTEEGVYNSLKTVLDPSFNKKAKELSERFRDRPMSPLDTAVYWVEYVARHKGAHHLKTAAVGMPFYQYLLLDVIAFLLVVSLVSLYISFYITRAVFRKIFKKQGKVKTN